MPRKDPMDDKDPRDGKDTDEDPKGIAARWQADADPNGKPDGTPGRTLTTKAEWDTAVALGKKGGRL